MAALITGFFACGVQLADSAYRTDETRSYFKTLRNTIMKQAI
jgi:hypothetical protein